MKIKVTSFVASKNSFSHTNPTTMKEYIPRIIQTTLTIPMIVLTVTSWHNNHIGQNLINLIAIVTLLIGMDNIIIFYRCYIDEQSVEIEATFVIFSTYVMAMLFEKFNRTENHSWFNYVS